MPNSNYDEFAGIFREEHRQVRDSLFELIQALQNGRKDQLGGILNRIAVLTGPHFRYEEEAPYLTLVDTFGADYIQKLLHDHDLAIGTAKRLVEIANREGETLSTGDVERGVKLTRSILPHVSDCEGLSIMVERFGDESVRSVLVARERARSDNLNLLRWAETIRSRPYVLPD